MNARSVLLGTAVLAVAIQFVPIPRDNPPVVSEIPVPEDVRAILQRACYDCHSNETRWPWYAYVAPVSFGVVYDVWTARQHMNFSTWSSYDDTERAHRFEEIADLVEKREMPLFYYVWFHSEADLDAADRDRIVQWSRANTHEHGHDHGHGEAQKPGADLGDPHGEDPGADDGDHHADGPGADPGDPHGDDEAAEHGDDPGDPHDHDHDHGT